MENLAFITMIQRWIFCFLIFQTSYSFGALPVFARNYLEKVPEKKLTLPFVIQTALINADAYRLIALQFQEAQLEELRVESQLDTLFTGGAQYNDDNSVKDSIFQPARIQSWNWDLGFAKQWSTGTRTSVKWIHEWSQSELSPTTQALFGNGAFNTNFKRTTALVSLEQSLLKNSFGSGLRGQREAAQKRGVALQWKSQEDLESTTKAFISEFYGAWLLQQQVSSLYGQVKRQERLVDIMQRKSRKGAVEKPELRQVKALLASTRAKLAQTRSQLTSQWESLVIGLKLPLEFLSVNPMDIPTQIDDPVPLSVRLCGLKEPKKTARLQSIEKNLQAAKADFRASKVNALPDLKLVAGYRGNSIDGSGSQTAQDIIDGRYEGGNPGLGPAWNVGLTLEWPLDNSMARADSTAKFINQEKLSSQWQIEKDQLKSQWRKLCRDLKVEWTNEKSYYAVVKDQKLRVKEENKRFSLGRISVNAWVTAEDDLGSWEFLSQQKSIEVRQLAWQVQTLTGELYKKISPLLEKRINKDIH